METNADTNKVGVKTVVTSSIWYTAANFITKALVFITTPVFSRILSTKEFGDFQVFANWQNIFVIVCGLEVASTINKARFDYKDEESINSYISSCLVLAIGMTTIALGVYLLFQDFFDALFLMDHRYIFILFVYLYTRQAIDMFQIEQRIHYRYKLSTLLSFSSAIITSLFALALALVMEDDRLFGRIFGQYIPFAVLGLVFCVYYFRRNHHISFDKCKYAMRLAIPMVFTFLGSQILLSSDKIVVQHLSSSEAVAYLGIATSCSHIMLIFVQCVNYAWQPWYYDKLAENDEITIKKIFRIYVWFIILCTFGALMLGPEIVWLLGGDAYAPSVKLLPANMLSGAFTLILSQYTALETFHNKPYYAAIVTAIVGIINIVGDIVGVHMFGYAAACYVTVACYVLLIGIHCVIARKYNAFNLFPLKEILLEIGVLLMFMPIAMLLYKSNISRCVTVLLFTAAFIVIAWKNKDKVKHFLKR